MSDSKPAALTKSSTVSVGLMIVVCGALLWQATTTATIRTELRALPVMQSDIKDVKRLLQVNNGIDMRQDAEMKALEHRIDRLDIRLDTLEKGK